jgi:hypothetical protein
MLNPETDNKHTLPNNSKNETTHLEPPVNPHNPYFLHSSSDFTFLASNHGGSTTDLLAKNPSYNPAPAPVLAPASTNNESNY